MHKANKKFWQYCNRAYRAWIMDGTVLEFGSLNVNGSVRDIFSGYAHWTGVDWRAGSCVELVSLAHDVRATPTDVVISCSMLEHDPHWDASIRNMVRHIDTNGVMFLSWGAALNPVHCLATSVDGGFHALKAGNVLRLLEKLNIYVHEFWYEGNFAPTVGKMGEVCLVAFPPAEPGVIAKIVDAVGSRHIDELLPEDRLDA